MLRSENKSEKPVKQDKTNSKTKQVLSRINKGSKSIPVKSATSGKRKAALESFNFTVTPDSQDQTGTTDEESSARESELQSSELNTTKRHN